MTGKKGTGKIEAMNNDALLGMLEEAVARLGLNLSYENLHVGEINTPGGLCELRGERLMIIHKGFSVREKIEVITDILSTLDTDGVHLSPGVRERIEAARAKKSRRALESA